MQHRLEGDVRIVRQRIAQRQGAMGGQLGDQPIRQRADGFVLLRRVDLGPVGAPPMVMTARWMAPLALVGGLRRIAIAALDRLDRRFVLGPDDSRVRRAAPPRCRC